jgi:hypothetical protein
MPDSPNETTKDRHAPALRMFADMCGPSGRDREALLAAASEIDRLRAVLLTIAVVGEGWAARTAKDALNAT